MGFVKGLGRGAGLRFCPADGFSWGQRPPNPGQFATRKTAREAIISEKVKIYYYINIVHVRFIVDDENNLKINII
jgi:hypothetical protein